MRFVLPWGALVSGILVGGCSGNVVYRASGPAATGAGAGGAVSSSASVMPTGAVGAGGAETTVGGSIAAITAAVGVGGFTGSGTAGVTVAGPGAGGWGTGSFGDAGADSVGFAAVSSAVSSSTSGVGGGVCGLETKETLTMAFLPPNGPVVGCYVGQPQAGGGVDQHIQGIITQTSATTFTIDSCPPQAICETSAVSNLSLSAPGLGSSSPNGIFTIPSGAFVDVHIIETSQGFGCADAIAIQNMPSWGSYPNPVLSTPHLWFAGSDGAPTSLLSDEPFAVMASQLLCFPGSTGCGGPPHDDYMFQFFATGAESILVPMGPSVVWWNPQVNELLEVHNMRSYASGACDDPGQWGYWVIEAHATF